MDPSVITSRSLTLVCEFSRPRMYWATCGTSSTRSRRVWSLDAIAAECSKADRGCRPVQTYRVPPAAVPAVGGPVGRWSGRSAAELEDFATDAGLEVETVAGDYDLGPLGSGGDRAIVVTRKA